VLQDSLVSYRHARQSCGIAAADGGRCRAAREHPHVHACTGFALIEGGLEFEVACITEGMAIKKTLVRRMGLREDLQSHQAAVIVPGDVRDLGSQESQRLLDHFQSSGGSYSGGSFAVESPARLGRN
jgi:hypothetical protein